MRLIIFCAALLGLGVLGVKGLNKAAPEVESRLEDKVVLNLAEEGHAWANVDATGRDISITGAATSVEAAENAISTADSLWGVSDVTSNIKIEETVKALTKNAAPYALTVTKTPEQVKIEGAVPSEDAKERLMRIAQSNYGKDNVMSELKVVPNAPAGWRSAAGSVIFNIGQFETAKAMLTEKDLTVTGTTVEENFGNHAQRMMTSALPEGYTTDFNIDVMNIEPAAGPTLVERILGDEKSDVNACAELAKAAEENILFAFDSSLLRSADKPLLNTIATAMAACERDNLVIHGHTDSVGADLYNQWLSEQRALAGKRYLMTQGVSKNRLSTIGHSEGTPTASNGTAEGRQLNRRAEFETVTPK